MLNGPPPSVVSKDTNAVAGYMNKAAVELQASKTKSVPSLAVSAPSRHVTLPCWQPAALAKSFHACVCLGMFLGACAWPSTTPAVFCFLVHSLSKSTNHRVLRPNAKKAQQGFSYEDHDIPFKSPRDKQQDAQLPKPPQGKRCDYVSKSGRPCKHKLAAPTDKFCAYHTCGHTSCTEAKSSQVPSFGGAVPPPAPPADPVHTRVDSRRHSARQRSL